jgi:hypothetical protein
VRDAFVLQAFDDQLGCCATRFAHLDEPSRGTRDTGTGSGGAHCFAIPAAGNELANPSMGKVNTSADWRFGRMAPADLPQRLQHVIYETVNS